MIVAAGLWASPSEHTAAAPPDSSLGLLKFVPEPELTICFCGSYLLTGEETFDDCYLFSDKFDLKLFIGKRILVTGRRFTDICSGTLAMPCSYLMVEKIVEQLSWGTEESTWGAVKSLYGP